VVSLTARGAIQQGEIFLRLAEPAGGIGSAPSSYAAESDAAGNFAIDGIAPGKYRLSASHTGFVSRNMDSAARKAAARRSPSIPVSGSETLSCVSLRTR
jgi:hypothetical protein